MKPERGVPRYNARPVENSPFAESAAKGRFHSIDAQAVDRARVPMSREDVEKGRRDE
jgi:hypothetical protein